MSYPRRTLRPLLTHVATAVVLVFAAAQPAGAHPAGQPNPDAAYYRSSVLEPFTTPAGVTVQVDPAGEFVELTNTGATEVIVLGYTREPYLRITAQGVWENMLSQTTYLNRSLFADSVPTGTDSATLAPAWQEVNQTGTATWHDHRIHWISLQRPPAVAADPVHPHLIGSWQLHATADGNPFTINGELRWLGKPDSGTGLDWVPRVGEALAVVIGLALVFLLGRRSRRPRVVPSITDQRVVAGVDEPTSRATM
jgi:hypothetical protein